MHMLIRFIYLFLSGRFRKPLIPGEPGKIEMRVLPIDLDFLLHVNNGVYFSYMDFGRIDMSIRNGTYKLTKEKGWYAVVAAESIKFRRSLKLWDKFTLETSVKGHDDRYFFFEQRFMLKGELMAKGLIKLRCLTKDGKGVNPAEIFKLLNQTTHQFSPELSEDWHGLEKKYLT